MRYEALPQPDSHSWRVRVHGEDPVKRPDGTNGLFCIMGLTEDQAHGIAKLLNKMDKDSDKDLVHHFEKSYCGF